MVDLARSTQLDSVEGRLQGKGQLRVGGRERRCRRRRQAAVAQQEPEGVGVHGDVPGHQLDRLGDQRQLEPMGVGGPEAAEHLACLEHATGPAAAAVG
jgi:hypothetical protein